MKRECGAVSASASSERNMRNLLAILLVGLLVGACARSEPPAPVVYGGSGGNAPTSTGSVQNSGSGSANATRASAGGLNTASRPSGAGIHTAQRGDSVYGVARRYGVPIRALIDANDLQPPYRLVLGQRLQIPTALTHRVARGETLYSISRRYGVDMRELARVNDLGEPYTIVAGQRLQISSGSTQMAAGERPRQPERSEPPSQSAGDTPSPSPSDQASSDTAVQSVDAAGLPPIPGRKPGAGTQTRTASAPAATPGEIPQPPPRAGSRFVWPVQGEVIQRFGSQDGGLHNDGINIAAARGTAVRAADNGVVAYVGNELRGFGNLLLIKHADNWVTAYAHVDTILVDRGEQVQRGEVVGRVGNSGSVSRPQLHFEVRRGTKAVDPLEQLERTTAAASN